MIRGVCLSDFAEFAQLFLALPRKGGPLAMLARSGFAYIAFARDYPEHYRFMFMTPRVAVCPEDEEQKSDPAQNAYAFLHQLILYAKSTGALREDITDTHQTAQTVWALVHGVSALEICRRSRYVGATRIHGSSHAVWRSVRSRL